MKRQSKKIHLNRETLTNLDSRELGQVGGATVAETLCGFNCSVVYTCPVTHCTV
jgi:hypothetical protein